MITLLTFIVIIAFIAFGFYLMDRLDHYLGRGGTKCGTMHRRKGTPCK